jgi:hypothetical protein
MKRIVKGIVVTVAVVAIAAGVNAAFARRPPWSCECAPIDAPVKCSNGVTYGSACIAACAGATNCVPTGGGGGNF